MKREPFLELVREALDSLPRKFRRRVQNVAVVVEDYPPEGSDPHHLLMGTFEGIPRTKQSFFAEDNGPSRIVLHQKNIGSGASSGLTDVKHRKMPSRAGSATP